MGVRTLPRWVTRLLAAPNYVYDWNGGWLLDRWFVRVTHEGRRSGRVYRTMLEVVGEDRAIGEVFVMAGLEPGGRMAIRLALVRLDRKQRSRPRPNTTDSAI
jgi:hypothetical protein